MSKQVYIDENGNEIQVSGTVNTADMMPMSGNDSTKVKTAIGNLSSLTTTHKDSLVNAVNDVNTKADTKADASSALKRESGSGSASGTTFTMNSGGATNACWLVFFGGTYVGIITIFSTNIAIEKLAGSINATVSLSGTTITITLSGAPWTQLRYVKLFG